MFGIGGPEMLLIGVIAVILLGGRSTIRAIKQAARQFADRMRELKRRDNQQPRITSIELITESRERTMKDRFKKFLWTPAFWTLLGIVGCTTGWYFQGIAANGTGLWCLGLMFLGAAYIEHQDVDM